MKMKQEIMGNSPWRIECEEEAELARKADRNWNSRIEYVEYYRKNDPAYHEKGIAMIDRTIGAFRGNVSKERKEEYTVDMLYSLHRFGCMYDEYFLMGFEFLNANGRSEFITDKNRWDYYSKLNGTRFDSLFRNKAETWERFGAYYHRDFIPIRSETDYEPFCEFREKHQMFIVKPSSGSGGRGVRIEKNTAEDHRTVFARLMRSAPVVVEELIQQHPSFKALHPGSVNTIRIPTMRYPNNEVKVFYPFLRIGVGDAIVDNATSGGIIAPVDAESGIVYQKGFTERDRYYFRHPETDFVIPGYQIPCYDGAVALVKELADIVPECRYVGWDCTLTEQGWIMVEGNLFGQFLVQYASKQGIKREMEEIVRDLA